MLGPKSSNENDTDPTKHNPTTNGEVYDVKSVHQEFTSLILHATVSLTIENDALIVVDESPIKRSHSDFWSIFANRHRDRLNIPLYNVLWAELYKSDLTVQYATQPSKDVARVASVSYPIGEDTERQKVVTWVTALLDASYGQSQKRKRIKVLVNPVGGKGRAAKWYSRDIEPIFAAARCIVDTEQTRHQGHGVEIAEILDVESYDVVACCSGDGLPHEVFNGLGRRNDAVRALRKIAVAQLPCGSGNAMCWNLCGTGSPSLAALRIVKGLRTPLDLISITQGDRRTLSFLSQSLGTVAETDLGTDHLRWMGDNRFTYGILTRILLGRAVHPCDIAVKVEVDDKAEIRSRYRQELHNHTPSNMINGADVTFRYPDGLDAHGEGLPPLKHGYVTDELPEGWVLVSYDTLGSFYVGNMAYMREDGNIFPAALPNDGCADLICIDGDLSRMSSLQVVMAVPDNKIFDLKQISYRKVTAYRIVPKGRSEGYISIDGERVPFEPFQAEVHRGLGTVLSMSGHSFEAPGVVERS